ncbi:hypothetical protein WBJ53_14890 [Spirosoma sp. SC4-14]|uniref:hypothetical protein n=1 Tax=Spirosoma sp. SC4-14 TaxID=3128900 RepID=UPI0030D54109
MLNSEINKPDGPPTQRYALPDPNPQISAFTKDLSVLMARHGIEQSVVVYTLLPNGSILSYSTPSALIEASNLINARIQQLSNPSQNTI